MPQIPDIEYLEKTVSQAKKIMEEYNLSTGDNFTVEKVGGIFNFLVLSRLMSPQSKSAQIEKYVTSCFKGESVPASNNTGDFKCANDKGDPVYYESKISTTNNTEKINVRQLRLWQKVDYYLIGYMDERDPFSSDFYVIPHKEMKKLAEEIARPCHGTTAANKDNTNVELGFAINRNDDRISRWKTNIVNEQISMEMESIAA